MSGLRAEQYTHARRVLRSSATEQERRTMPVCLLCQVELDGVGRTYFDTIEDAMRAFGSYADTRVTIGEHVRKTYVQ
ncbi:MAG: hypothetical protein M3Y26_12390 [Actinomycetota bacterium]|nr:hypothetical protein [Actinomycetota bacterium]